MVRNQRHDIDIGVLDCDDDLELIPDQEESNMWKNLKDIGCVLEFTSAIRPNDEAGKIC